MNKFIFIPLLLISIGVTGQVKDSCNVWESKTYYKSIDTIKVIVKFVGTAEGRYEHIISSTDPCFAFYKTLQKKYNLLDELMFQPIGCNKIFSYPNSYKKSYGTKLYHKPNSSGVYEDIKEGRLIEITCIRYNRTYKDIPELITIITAIKLLEETLPVIPPY